MSYYQSGGPARGNPYAAQSVSFKQARSRTYAEQDTTAPERIPVKESTLTHCGTCRKQVWTDVRRVRAGVKRNGATDAMFHVISVALVHIETDYNHYCPHCGRKFEIYRLVGHKARQQSQSGGQNGVSSPAAQGKGIGYPGDMAARGYLGGAFGPDLQDKPIRGDSPDDPLPPYTEKRTPTTNMHANQEQTDPKGERPDQESVRRLLPSIDTRGDDDQSFVSASQVSFGH